MRERGIESWYMYVRERDREYMYVRERDREFM